jgi:hypothetical protein
MGVTCQYVPTPALGVWVRTVLPATHPATHSRSHFGMCLPCVPDPTHTLSDTLLCI